MILSEELRIIYVRVEMLNLCLLFCQDTWQWWNSFRMMGNTNSKINVSLEINQNIPSEVVCSQFSHLCQFYFKRG